MQDVAMTFCAIAGDKCSGSGVSALLRCHLELCFWFGEKEGKKRKTKRG